MDAEVFGQFMQRLGYRIIKTASAYWYNVGPLCYLNFPFHRTIMPTSEELSVLWRSPRVMVVRYSTDLEGRGYSSYRFVCRSRDYDLHSLPSNVRNQVRTGLKKCKVRLIDYDLLMREGLDVYVDTMRRQSRKVTDDLAEYWRRYCEAAALTPGMEAWGAFVGNELAAYLIGFIMDGCYNIFIHRSHRDLLGHYPNNALVYTVVQSALERTEIDEVSYGLESLQSELDGLVRFKIGMGFTKEPIRQSVVFRPLIHPVIKVSAGVIFGIARKYPDNEAFRKLSGLTRFALGSE